MSSSSSVIKPRPTSEVLQAPQIKQSLCQCLSSKEMKRVPPIPAKQKSANDTNSCLSRIVTQDRKKISPVIGFVQAVQRLANNSPKQSAQYGFSSRLVKR